MDKQTWFYKFTLGTGTFGRVIKVQHSKTKKSFAVKLMNLFIETSNPNKKLFFDPKNLKNLWLSELEFTELCQHPNVIRSFSDTFDHGIFAGYHSTALFMECCECNLLTKLKTDRISPFQVHNYFRQIIDAVNYLHSHDICHRDLKLENFLILRDSIKLIDFGFAFRFDPSKSLQRSRSCGSLNYASPEIILNLSYWGPEIDIWSLGVILFALIFKCLPFYHIEINEIKKKIISCSLPEQLKHRYNGESFDLLTKMLSLNKNARPSCASILEHPWMKNTPKPNSQHLTCFGDLSSNLICKIMNTMDFHDVWNLSFVNKNSLIAYHQFTTNHEQLSIIDNILITELDHIDLPISKILIKLFHQHWSYWMHTDRSKALFLVHKVIRGACFTNVNEKLEAVFFIASKVFDYQDRGDLFKRNLTDSDITDRKKLFRYFTNHKNLNALPLVNKYLTNLIPLDELKNRLNLINHLLGDQKSSHLRHSSYHLMSLLCVHSIRLLDVLKNSYALWLDFCALVNFNAKCDPFHCFFLHSPMEYINRIEFFQKFIDPHFKIAPQIFIFIPLLSQRRLHLFCQRYFDFILEHQHRCHDIVIKKMIEFSRY